MKKILALLLAMLLCVSMFGGCKKTDEQENEQQTNEEMTDAGNMVSADCKGSVLAWNLGIDSQTLDPAWSNTADSMSVVNNTFEGLMRDTGNGVQPALAEEIPSQTENEDGTVTLTYTIKEAFWSDGQPVRAQDFEFAWKRCANPETGADNAYLMNVLANYEKIAQGQADIDELGVKALDDSTLEVTLRQPTAYFNELLCLPAFMPLREDVVDMDGSWAKDPQKAVSNGPFTLAGYTEGKELVFQKNEQYWNKETVNLDYIVARMLDDNFAPVGMAFGDIMITDGEISQPENQTDTEGNVVEVPQLPETLETTTVSSNRFTTLVVNANTGNKMLNDERVRAALTLSLDREAAAQAAGGEAMLTMGGEQDLLAGSSNLSKAQDLLDEYFEEAGDDSMDDRSIEIVYLENDKTSAALETVKSAWEALGLSVKLTAQDAQTFQRSRNSLQYDDLLCSVWEVDAPDQQLYLQPYLSSNMQSGCGYSNQDFDKLMMEAMQSEGSARTKKLSEAEMVLIDDAYVMPLYRDTLTVTSDSAKLSGWTVSANGSYWFGNASLTAE